MTCAACAGAIKRHRVLGFIHVSGRYWCGSDHLTHASPAASASVLFCTTTRQCYGY